MTTRNLQVVLQISSETKVSNAVVKTISPITFLTPRKKTNYDEEHRWALKDNSVTVNIVHKKNVYQ